MSAVVVAISLGMGALGLIVVLVGFGAGRRRVHVAPLSKQTPDSAD
jgi:hypothetical protein